MSVCTRFDVPGNLLVSQYVPPQTAKIDFEDTDEMGWITKHYHLISSKLLNKPVALAVKTVY